MFLAKTHLDALLYMNERVVGNRRDDFIDARSHLLSLEF